MQQKTTSIQEYFGYSDKEFKSIQLDAKMNLPKHLMNGSFGEKQFHSVVHSKYIDRMSCVITLATIHNGNNQEYLKALLQVLFAKLSNHLSATIKKDASRAMVEIHHRVNDCLKLFYSHSGS